MTMPASLAEQLYHRWRRAQHDITEHPAWGNLESEQRLAWEAVAERATLVLTDPEHTAEACRERFNGFGYALPSGAIERRPLPRVELGFAAVTAVPDLHGDVIEPAALAKAVEEYPSDIIANLNTAIQKLQVTNERLRAALLKLRDRALMRAPGSSGEFAPATAASIAAICEDALECEP